jgi:hypothetical protein
MNRSEKYKWADAKFDKSPQSKLPTRHIYSSGQMRDLALPQEIIGLSESGGAGRIAEAVGAGRIDSRCLPAWLYARQ